ncbi:ABC transporter permease [Paenibacillus kobensis]|uniref:ABC transporter permease n=1 Tax=Paenibacillus kobensis TaxID=59841 RepID=UPI000FDBC9C0|nr:ABC-2 family transporter protein [Paenibacillus kobensis]
MTFSWLRKPRRTFFLYRRLFGAQLKAILEYQSDFYIMIVSAVLTQLLGIVFLWVVYNRIPDINGWTFWEVVFMYAMVYLTEGFGSLFFEGTWRLGRIVNNGELDVMLLRPVSPILQVLSYSVGMNGLGNIVIGIIMISQALIRMDLHWSLGKIIIAVLLVVTAILIRVSINLAANTTAFWFKNAGNAFPMMIHNLGEFAKYPITIFSLGVQLLVAVLIPFAFISFFPAYYLFDKSSAPWFWIACPVAAIYCAAVAYTVFHFGLRKYESVGN